LRIGEDNVADRPLDGQVAIVTGGASGIGRATAINLAAKGAAAAILDRDTDGSRATLEAIETAGGAGAVFAVDLSQVTTIPAAVAQVLDWGKRIDILVNSAGVSGPEQVLTMTEAAWDFVLTVNLKAPVLLMKAVAQHMVERGGGGRIVNLSSSAAFRAAGPNAPHYAASKAALSAVTRTAAGELGRHGINVNAVAPGVTKTPMTQRIGDDEAYKRAASEGPLANLLGRASEASDVAAVITFLCLPESRQITAQTVHTSAGLVV
jgi:NAD(P)-dependent dehydrogenase (short-subunit alcohol dehydrogenase family)